MDGNILIIGDIHLGKGQTLGRSSVGNGLNTRILDQIKLLDWILHEAHENNVTMLILVGDIFEEFKPELSLIKIFFNFIDKARDLGLEVHIILGNHDLKRVGNQQTSFLDLLEYHDHDDIYFHKEMENIYHGDVGITLIPFRDRKSTGTTSHDAAIEKLQKDLDYETIQIPLSFTKIALGHLALEGAIFVGDEVDDQANELMCPISMFNQYDFTWMGHVHKPQAFSKQPYVAHIGSLDLSDFGETNHQKVLILFETDSRKFREIPVPSRPLRSLSCVVPGKEATTPYVLKFLKEANADKSLENCILRLEIKLESLENPPSDREQVKQLIYQLGTFHISHFIESRTSAIAPPAEGTKVIDNNIKPKEAIKLWVKKQKTLSKEDQGECLKYALEVLSEHLGS